MEWRRILKLGFPLFIIFYSSILFPLEKIHWVIVISLIIIQLFLYICLFRLYFWFKHRYERWNHRRNINKNVRIRRKIQKMINKSKIVHFKEDCIICLEVLDGSIILKCGHIYHRHCLDQMLEYNIILCPLCRSNLV